MRGWGWLGLGLLLTGCHPHPKLTDAWPKQVLGSPYTQARRILMSQGFKTAHYGASDTLRKRAEMCDDIQGYRCRAYQETWDCQGPGACEFDFIRVVDRRVLMLTTDGEFPPSVNDAHWADDAAIKARNITNR
jgi:hypothetical protein